MNNISLYIIAGYRKALSGARRLWHWSTHALAWHGRRSTPRSPAGLPRFRLLPGEGFFSVLNNRHTSMNAHENFCCCGMRIPAITYLKIFSVLYKRKNNLNW